MKTCGTCIRWHLYDEKQLTEYPSKANRAFDIGNCRIYASDRFRAELPLGLDCHQPDTTKQESKA